MLLFIQYYLCILYFLNVSAWSEQVNKKQICRIIGDKWCGVYTEISLTEPVLANVKIITRIANEVYAPKKSKIASSVSADRPMPKTSLFMFSRNLFSNNEQRRHFFTRMYGKQEKRNSISISISELFTHDYYYRIKNRLQKSA